MDRVTLYGAAASGSVAVEAALLLLGIEADVIEGPGPSRRRATGWRRSTRCGLLLVADGRQRVDEHLKLRGRWARRFPED